MANYKFTYFDIRALGEPARYIFKAAGVPFDDVRVGFEEWPKMKASSPFGHLPMLEFNGQTFCESKAICRYLGSQHGLMPATDVDRLRADMLVDGVDDARKPIPALFGAQRRGDKDELAKLIKSTETDFTASLGNLDKCLPASGFITGTKMTWADIYFSSLIEFFESASQHFGFTLNIDRFPKIVALKNQVFSNPQIAAYRESRPTPTGPNL